jgi:hypothetical protein
MLVIFTDGISEAMDGNHQEFGEDRLEALIQSCHNRQRQELWTDMSLLWTLFVGDAPQHDDMTLVVMRAGMKWGETGRFLVLSRGPSPVVTSSTAARTHLGSACETAFHVAAAHPIHQASERPGALNFGNTVVSLEN